MATMTLPQTSQMIVTLESGAVVSDIRKALKLIRGIASVRMATIGDDRIIYDIYDNRITVLIIQAEEHYNDK